MAGYLREMVDRESSTMALAGDYSNRIVSQNKKKKKKKKKKKR